jgi:hypothetical protein
VCWGRQDVGDGVVIRSVSWRSVCVGHVVAKGLRPPFLTLTWHNLMGKMMASFNTPLAALSPTTSSHWDVRLIDKDYTREERRQVSLPSNEKTERPSTSALTSPSPGTDVVPAVGNDDSVEMQVSPMGGSRTARRSLYTDALQRSSTHRAMQSVINAEAALAVCCYRLLVARLGATVDRQRLGEGHHSSSDCL